MTAVNIESLSKKYVISHQRQERYTALRDVMANMIRSPWSRRSNGTPTNEDFWALKDISFDVIQGDKVGIIGRNGAGKSTLLKIISRITEPTNGRISIKGRVSSLLEVGTGFHPELTGRENIFLNGAILGMGKAEIKRKFDEIVAFAEVEKFLDTPVKRYSSGMYVRLAFAVAAHLEPEILVVDEVLAVGDIQFQKKCLGKMKSVGQEGRTVLFVSHSMDAISSLCTKGILLESGKMAYAGKAVDAVDRYLNNRDNSDNPWLKWVAPANRYPIEDSIKIKGYCILDEDNNVTENNLLNSKKYRVKVDLEMVKPTPDIRVAFAIYASDVQLLLTSSANDGGLVNFEEIRNGDFSLSAPLPVDLFSNGTYAIELLSLIERVGWVLTPGNESRLRFNVYRDIETNPYIQYRLGGVTSPLTPTLNWSMENV